MGLRAYRKAVAVINNDILSLILNSFSAGELTPEVLYDKFVYEIKKFKFWIWDTFNFDTMSIPQAIDIESRNRVFYNPNSGIEYPIKSIGYTLIEKTSGYFKYNVVVVDDTDESEFANSLARKFKMEHKNTDQFDGKYYYRYELISD